MNPLQSVLSALQAAQASSSSQRTQPTITTPQQSSTVSSSVLNPNVLQQLQQLQAVLGQNQSQPQAPSQPQVQPQVSTQQTGVPLQLLSQLQQIQQHLLSSGQQGQTQPNFQQQVSFSFNFSDGKASNIQNAQLLQQQLQQQQAQLQQLQRLQTQQLSQSSVQQVSMETNSIHSFKKPQTQQGFSGGDQWRQQSSQQMGFGQQVRSNVPCITHSLVLLLDNNKQVPKTMDKNPHINKAVQEVECKIEEMVEVLMVVEETLREV